MSRIVHGMDSLSPNGSIWRKLSPHGEKFDYILLTFPGVDSSECTDNNGPKNKTALVLVLIQHTSFDMDFVTSQ